ncbi:MAG: GUN4 domain-containing protein [Spirulinaceae cyanobacterium]
MLPLKVQPFDPEQIQQFVRNWYQEVEALYYPYREDVAAQAAHEQTTNLLNAINNDKNLKKLAENPLLLTLITKVHQQKQSLPQKRVELYHLICDVLLGERPKAKAMQGQFSIAEKRSILEPLALELMQRNAPTFRFEAVTAFLQQQLDKFPNPPTPQAFLKQLEDVDALIAKEREGDYEFAHKSFQEYLAAARVKETKDDAVFLQVLQDPKNLSWWEETMRLYAAQTDASRLVDAIVQKPALEKMLLAWDFCQEGRVGATQRNALLDLSNEPLKVLEPEDYQAAVELQPRYFPLAHYLQTGDLRAADRETYRVMDRVMGGWSLQGIKDFPCQDLRVIDQLWLKYSQGKFGFSVQKQIWVEVGGKLDYAEDLDSAETAWSELYELVNWRTVRYGLTAPRGHLPVTAFVTLVGGSSSLASRSVDCNL